MRSRVAILAVLAFSVASLASAEPRWIRARLGPFEAISDDGRKPAVQALSQFAEFSFALGSVLGQPDLKLEPPVRIIIFKSEKDLSAHCPGEALRAGRDRLMACAVAEGQLDRTLLRALTKKLLEANFPTMPAAIEAGLVSFFSTLQSNAVHVTWGAPPPALAERTREWALLHRIITQPDYAGKTSIYLHNLASGMERAAAARNALGEEAAKFDADVDRYLAAGVFTPVPAPSRPLNPDRDVSSTALTTDEGELMRADLLTAESRSAYEDLLKSGKHTTEANEGLGILALRGHDAAGAAKYMEAARAAGTKNYVALTDYAAQESNPGIAVEFLQDALTIEPKYALAHWIYGEKVEDPRRRRGEWKQAVDLAPRNWEWAAKYAELALHEQDYSEAARAFTAAALAAPDAATRDRYLNARANIETQRLAAQDEERRREALEKEREINRLKSEARREIADLEARVNRSRDAAAARTVDWFDSDSDGRITGTLRRVDCAGKTARLVVEDDAGKLQTVFVSDPSQLVIQGGGDSTLACGPQKQQRKVTVAWKKSALKDVLGEATGLEFD